MCHFPYCEDESSDEESSQTAYSDSESVQCDAFVYMYKEDYLPMLYPFMSLMTPISFGAYQDRVVILNEADEGPPQPLGGRAFMSPDPTIGLFYQTYKRELESVWDLMQMHGYAVGSWDSFMRFCYEQTPTTRI